jgi:hypothetical protein
VYARVSAFYEERVVPLTKAGSNVLVVSHQYALEPLVLYLCNKGPDDYAGAMDLPNGKALSVDDMRKFEKHHGSSFTKLVRCAAGGRVRGRAAEGGAGVGGLGLGRRLGLGAACARARARCARRAARAQAARGRRT